MRESWRLTATQTASFLCGYCVLIFRTKRFLKVGCKDVKLKLYKDGRHEMLNELNKDEVYADILDWLNSKI